MDYNELVEILKRIPHMNLGFDFEDDLFDMVRETKQIDAWYPFVNHWNKNDKRQVYKDIWEGRCIFNYSGDSHAEMGGHTPEELKNGVGLPLKLTDLGKKMPTIVKAIEQIGGHYRFCRIMRIRPGTGLPWHCHSTKNRQLPDMLTVHLPIIMPKEFIFAVTTEDNIDSNLRSIDKSKIYAAKYRPGRAYMFNSYHWHMVTNPSGQDRLSIMMMLPLAEKQVFDIIHRAVESYRGPFIEENR